MKALRTKVILSGIVLVFAFIATIGTTFAWFTVSQTATVDTMTLNVTSAEGLGILPVDATNFADPTLGYVNDGSGAANDLGTASNYEPLIEVSDLFGASYEIGPSAVTPWRVSPATVVATAYDSYDAKTLNYLTDLTSARTLGAASSNSSDGQYLELKFWVFLQGEESETFSLELIDTSSISSTAGNTTNQADIADAIRLVVWADDTDYGTGGSEGDAFIFGNSLDYSYTFSGDFAVGNNDLSSNEATPSDLANLTNLNSVTTDHFDLATYTASPNPTDLFTITTNTPTLVTVLIFVEGWDAEATNDISLAQFDIKFGFQIGTTD
jgi:hypothetical protein